MSTSETQCACRQWVRLYGVGEEGERHHRDCKHWNRKLDADVYVTRTELIVVGSPDHDDVNHNCDAMGCTSVSHVLFRFPLTAGVAPAVEAQPAAVVGSDYTLLWAGGDAISDIVKRHGLRVGSKLYAHPAGLPVDDVRERMAAALEAVEDNDLHAAATILRTAIGGKAE
jgi:hypothetical protein